MLPRQNGFEQGQFFRIHTCVTAVSLSGKREAVVVPEDALLQLVRHPSSEHERMAHMTWNGQAVLIFESDLVERATPVQVPHRRAAKV